MASTFEDLYSEAIGSDSEQGKSQRRGEKVEKEAPESVPPPEEGIFTE